MVARPNHDSSGRGKGTFREWSWVLCHADITRKHTEDVVQQHSGAWAKLWGKIILKTEFCPKISAAMWCWCLDATFAWHQHIICGGGIPSASQQQAGPPPKKGDPTHPWGMAPLQRHHAGSHTEDSWNFLYFSILKVVLWPEECGGTDLLWPAGSVPPWPPAFFQHLEGLFSLSV